jgi:hypothetical protein
VGLYSIDEPYSVSTWYDLNGASDLWVGTDLLLDLTRHVIDSGAYVFQGVAFPKGQDVAVGYGQTFSGSLNLIPNSYLVGLTGFSRNGNQYTLRIWDKGAQTDLYYGQFAWYPTVISNMQKQENMGEFILIGDQDKPFGPYLFRDPLIVLPPGILQVQLTNVQTVPDSPGLTQMVQILFMLAVPKTTTSLGNRKVQTPTDQSGTATLQNLAAGLMMGS